MSDSFVETGRAKVRRFCSIVESKWSSGGQEAPGTCAAEWGRIFWTWRLTGKSDELKLEESSELGGEQ